MQRSLVDPAGRCARCSSSSRSRPCSGPCSTSTSTPRSSRTPSRSPRRPATRRGRARRASPAYVEYGASPRGPIALVQSARALALIHGRDYVLGTDVRALAKDALRHRLVLTYRALAEQRTADDVLDAVLASASRRRRSSSGGRSQHDAACRAFGVVETPERPGPGPMPEPLLRALELSIGRRVDGLLAGDHRSHVLGRGSELAQVRPYVPGDDVRLIDWNVTARTREPHIRVQLAERVLVTWVVLDRTPSMGFGTADRRKADVALGVALALGHAASVARQPRRARLVRRAGRRRRCRRGRVAPGSSGCCSRSATRTRRRARRPSSRRRSTLARRRRPPARARRRRLRLPRPARLAPPARRPRRPPRRARRRDPRPARGPARRRGRGLVRRSRRPGGACASTPATRALRARFAEAAAQERARRRARPRRGAGVARRALDERRLAARPRRPPREAPVSFGTPIALLGLLVVPVRSWRCSSSASAGARRRARGSGRRRSSPRRRPPPRRIRQAAAVRPRARRPQRADRRRRAAAGEALRPGRAGDRHPRARHLPLDGRDGREAVAARGRGGRRAHVPRRRARGATRSASSRSRRGPRVVLSPTTDRDAARDGARPDHARLGDGARRRDRPLRRGGAAGSQPGQPTPKDAHARRRSSLLSDGEQTAGDRQPLAAAAQRAASSGSRQHGRARHARRGRRGAAAERAQGAGHGRRPTRRRCSEIARITGGRFAAAPTAERLKQVYSDLGSRIGAEAREARGDRRVRGRRASCSCSSPRGSRSPGRGGRCEDGASLVARRRRRRGRAARSRPGRPAPPTSARACGSASPSQGPWVVVPAGGVDYELACPLAGYIVAGTDARVATARRRRLVPRRDRAARSARA